MQENYSGVDENSVHLVSLGRQITLIGAPLRCISGQSVRATSAGPEDYGIMNSFSEFPFGRGRWLGALPVG